MGSLVFGLDFDDTFTADPELCEKREEAMNEPRDVLMVGLFALSVGISLGAMCQDKYEEGQAVKHGAARYNPKTGGFEWLDEIDKK